MYNDSYSPAPSAGGYQSPYGQQQQQQQQYGTPQQQHAEVANPVTPEPSYQQQGEGPMMSPLAGFPPLAYPGAGAVSSPSQEHLQARLRAAKGGETGLQLVPEGVAGRLRELEKKAAALQEENTRLRAGVKGGSGGGDSNSLDVALLRAANEDLKEQLERERHAKPAMSDQTSGQISALVAEKAKLKSELDAAKRENVSLAEQVRYLESLGGHAEEPSPVASPVPPPPTATADDAAAPAEEASSPAGGTDEWPDVDGADEWGGGDWGGEGGEGGGGADDYGL